MSNQNQTDAGTEHIKKLSGLIKDVRVAMLTTMDENGIHRSRPMATQQVDFDGSLWFFNRADSPKSAEIKDNQNVNVSYSDPDHQIYVSVSGTASLVIDRQKMEELWNPTIKAWFPKGIDDPELSLIRVDVEQAEHWDAPSSPVAHIIGFVKSKLTGRPGNIGNHEKIDLEAEKAASRS